MVFAKPLRAGVRRGFITCSVRIWKSPRVKVGHRYAMEEGAIQIESIEAISLQDITPELARESGFASKPDLLKVARHGAGENVYLVRFHFVPGL
ncbi:MAG: ASCH domain-containing protein [Bryobacterales bacterium]|nr:ASCH domain-containing protein [Bryobacterales bacterium]